jgi:hypothetical protein
MRSFDNTFATRLASHLGAGLAIGTSAGALAGAADAAIAGAITADREAFSAALFLGFVGCAFGAVFGATTGLALALLMLPLRGRPRVLRRLRLVWGLCAAVIVWGLCSLVFGTPTLDPGPNETIQNLRRDLLWFYVGPSLLALVLGTALVPLLARDQKQPARGVDAT